MSSQIIRRPADVLRRHRNQLGSSWRKLSAGRQSLLVVAYLRKGETYVDMAYGVRFGTSTAFRHVDEAIDLHAELAPTRAGRRGRPRKAFVVLDGSLLRIDCVVMGSDYKAASTRASTSATV